MEPDAIEAMWFTGYGLVAVFAVVFSLSVWSSLLEIRKSSRRTADALHNLWTLEQRREADAARNFKLVDSARTESRRIS